MRVVFMGTPDFAVPSLGSLAEAHDVALVITRPDAVRGRGKRAVPSPVRLVAEARALPVLCSARVTPEVLTAVAETAPDVVAVAAFGALLPDELLAMPTRACVNVHASLLPRWRGAAPIQRAILAGDDRLGVSIMRMAHELDAGPYCRQASVAALGRGATELTAVLAELGAQELVAALDEIAAGSVVWTAQDEADVTYAPKVTKAEMLLLAADPAETNARRVAASTDAAPARCEVAGRGLRVLAARPERADLAEGAVLSARGRVLLGCSDGALELLRVRPDGKRDMDAAAWAAGLRGSAHTWGGLTAPAATQAASRPAARPGAR